VKEQPDGTLVIGAPAKINLFLHVLNRREDGYHNIDSLFQAVSLFDRLRLHRTERPGIRLSVTNAPDLSMGDDNLICRAWRLMQERFDLPGGLAVELEKNIPLASGLAGGSTDAAATMAACRRLFDIGLSQSEMAELGAEVGSDVPFFFSSGQARVSGRGERIAECALPTDYWVVLVCPKLRLSTAEAYASLKRSLTSLGSAVTLSLCETVHALSSDLAETSNEFEKVHVLSYPELAEIRHGLLESGASLARMSGSGPTMYGLFAWMPEAESLGELVRGDWQVFTVRPITLPGQTLKRA
jgi:4-diphosphocytidyl-2-C-methyl-D-erythritol kinase